VRVQGARESAYLRQVNFYTIVILRGHVRTVPGNMLVIFEVRSSAIHFVHLAEAIKNPLKFLDPRGSRPGSADRYQYLIDCSLGHAPTPSKVLSKSVHNVLRKPADRQTDGQR